MILQSLVTYYEALARRGEADAPGYAPVGVSYALVLSPDGVLKQVVSRKRLPEIQPSENEKKPKKEPVPLAQKMTVPAPYVRSSGVCANFLCDNAIYFLGMDVKGDPERAKRCFEAAKSLHQTLLATFDHPLAQAICRFFDTWNPDACAASPLLAEANADLLKGAYLIFESEHFECAQDVPAIRQAWDHYRSDREITASGRCLVTGNVEPIAILHDKIKGVDGAQSVGANLISFNARAYESYGNENSQGLNAHVGETAAFEYAAALNRLLADRKHRRKLGDTIIVWWSGDAAPETQDIFADLTFGSDESEVLSSTMKQLLNGTLPEQKGIDLQNPFCILGLSPNAARLSVRFFLRDSFGNILNHVCAHYARLNVYTAGNRDMARSFTPWALLNETVSPSSRDKSASPLLAGAFLNAVLHDTPYPALLYNAVLLRIRAEHEVTTGKAAIIKAYLLRNSTDPKIKEVITVALNEKSENRAYVLGRLFSVLEQAQGSANGSSNLRERYFTSACATPGLTFPTLLKLSVHHEAKSEYGKKYDIAKTELLGKLAGEPLPARLTNEEQGLFILGYYHETQKRFTKKTTDTETVGKM